MATPIVHERIREPNLHGERFTCGDRMAEACRVGPFGQWSVFCYIAGKAQLRADLPGVLSERMTWGKARRVAKEWAGGAP